MFHLNFTALLEGFLLSATLIIAIGAQNAFVLKKGLLKEHQFLTAALCSAIDAFLIILGALGLGSFFNKAPKVLIVVTFMGGVFLAFYGIKSFLSAITASSYIQSNENKSSNLKMTVLSILALSLLNPHVYIDTVILLGGLSAKYPFYERISFVIGAFSASFIWFFSLSYGAAYLSKLFQSKKTWQVLDFSISLLMFFISYKLFNYAIQHI